MSMIVIDVKATKNHHLLSNKMLDVSNETVVVLPVLVRTLAKSLSVDSSVACLVYNSC